MNFLAIDFETANEKRNSACSLGFAFVKNGNIHQSLSILIRPPELYFNPFNVSLHGITEEDVCDRPTFEELWPQIKKVLDGQLVVAHNGVELEKFQDTSTMKEYREELGLPVDKKIICYAGNIYEGRGVEKLIDVSLRLKNVLFLIVGGLEEDVNRYKRIVQEKGAHNFELAGFVPHKMVPPYLLASDILVMPYTTKMTIKGGTKAQEFTSPIKLFEYMAAVRPIVATSISSVKEILEDGVNAVLVEPDSADSLFEGLLKVIEDHDLADRIALNAGADIKNYTWEERVKKLLGLE